MLIARTYKSILLLSSNLFLLPIGAAVNLFFIPSERGRARAQAVMTMLWARLICVLLGIRVTKHGQRRKGAVFTVCNHASYVDVLVMGCQRPTAFLSMQEVKGWPIIGWMAYLGGTVFVNRNSKRAALDAMTEIEKKMAWGITVIIFPEGGTSDGRSVRAFKSTFFKIPVSMSVPVRPASIRYAENIVEAVAWHSGAHIAPHFWNLAGLKKIRASVFYGAPIQPLAEWATEVGARKQLCALARERVAAGFEGKKQH